MKARLFGMTALQHRLRYSVAPKEYTGPMKKAA
jgi:hypothetical protein